MLEAMQLCRRIAAAVLLAVAAAVAPATADPAAAMRFDTSTTPIVRIVGLHGQLVVRTWDQNAIAVSTDTFDQPIDEERRTMIFGTIPRSFPIPAQTLNRSAGPIVLPPEDFVVASIAPGPHDAFLVRTHSSATTVIVPSTTALLVINTGGGTIDLAGYHGAFIVGSHNAAISMHDVGGDGFVQSIGGPIDITDSDFDRIRVRGGMRNLRFERCNVRQIEATAISGNVVYDAGTFLPGLARFDSMNGDVAIGIASGSVVIGAHTPAGHVFSAFAHAANVQQAPGEANAQIGAGGPLVTASSEHGSIFLYDGSLRDKRNLSAAWRTPVRALVRVPRVPR